MGAHSQILDAQYPNDHEDCSQYLSPGDWFFGQAHEGEVIEEEGAEELAADDEGDKGGGA